MTIHNSPLAICQNVYWILNIHFSDMCVVSHLYSVAIRQKFGTVRPSHVFIAQEMAQTFSVPDLCAALTINARRSRGFAIGCHGNAHAKFTYHIFFGAAGQSPNIFKDSAGIFLLIYVR